MCAISGGKNKEEVKKMLQIMKHRAPDGSGVVDDGRFVIGMGRLAIIDLKSSDLCPYSEVYKNRKYVLTFNGEIYNFIELRKELRQAGWEFRTTSDIEVVLKSYFQWGIKCLDKFNGMFAFVIYDGRNVFLARDIAGEKPLYFSYKPFKFASEAKALNWDCIEFPRAHYMIWSEKKGVEKFEQYWRLKKIKIKNAEKELEKLLENAIKIRTRADVPYGLYFSKGVDSSLISTFHKFQHKFTYKDGDYRKEFFKRFPKILWHLDYPVSSFSAFGLFKLAELASKKVKVVLSGEGADELFGGYVRYVQPHFNWMAQKAFPSYKGYFKEAESVTAAGWREFNGNLRELLRMGDRMSSAWGIETRCPFLDKRIIEFAFSLPDELKINGLDIKVILNRILKKRNPKYKSIEKMGLFCSVNSWLGSKDSFNKNDYLKYQKFIWTKLAL